MSVSIETKKLTEKIQQGLKIAYERMIAEKRKNNQQIVVMKEGKIVKINP